MPTEQTGDSMSADEATPQPSHCPACGYPLLYVETRGVPHVLHNRKGWATTLCPAEGRSHG